MVLVGMEELCTVIAIIRYHFGKSIVKHFTNRAGQHGGAVYIRTNSFLTFRDIHSYHLQTILLKKEEPLWAILTIRPCLISTP